MSESSGGQALKVRSTSDNQIEVRLLFKSTDYTLPQLTSRLQDVDALMKLLLQGKSVLNPGRPLSKESRTALRQIVEKQITRGITPSKGISVYNSGLGFTFGRFIRSKGRDFRAFTAASQTKVRVESVSLHSPLEIILLVTGPLAVLASITKLLPKFIQVKNDWNKSREIRAESNLKIERLKLEQEVVKLVAAEVEKIDMETYFDLPDNHPSKKIVKRSVQALNALDKAEVRE